MTPASNLPPITNDDKEFITYNPNTDDVIEFIRSYALAAIAAGGKPLSTESSLSDGVIDMIFDMHQDAPTVSFRYLVSRALIEADRKARATAEPVAWVDPEHLRELRTHAARHGVCNTVYRVTTAQDEKTKVPLYLGGPPPTLAGQPPTLGGATAEPAALLRELEELSRIDNPFGHGLMRETALEALTKALGGAASGAHQSNCNLTECKGQPMCAKCIAMGRAASGASPAPEPEEFNLHDVVPPSALEWLEPNHAAASESWMTGWDACRNRTRLLVMGLSSAMSQKLARPVVGASPDAELQRILTMPEAEIDAEIRVDGGDPDDYAARGGAAIATALAQMEGAIRDATCPMCGKAGPHNHTPEEIIIFRNGAKFAFKSANPIKPIAPQTQEFVDTLNEADKTIARIGIALRDAPKRLRDMTEADFEAIGVGANPDLCAAVLDLNTGWNNKEPEHKIAERIDLCRRLAVVGASPEPTARALLLRALDALLYHREQTRPIARTDAAIDALSTALAVTPEPTGFEVRVAGPDDVLPFADELDAHRYANAINKTYLADRLKHPDNEVLFVATVHPVGAAVPPEIPHESDALKMLQRLVAAGGVWPDLLPEVEGILAKGARDASEADFRREVTATKLVDLVAAEVHLGPNLTARLRTAFLEAINEIPPGSASGNARNVAIDPVERSMPLPDAADGRPA